MDTLIYLGSFLVTILILVTVHEFGHYWVARRCGVRVLRFSIGFGNPIFKWVDKHGTEWSVAPIPLGGYVKMFGEAKVDGEQEETVPPELQHESFAHQSVGRRMAIVFAGPAINLLLAVLVFWLQAMVGVPDRANQVAYVLSDSLAAHAGIESGDTVLSADGQPVQAWSEVHAALAEAAIEQRDVALTIEREGVSRIAELELSCLPAYAEITDILYTIGMQGGEPASLVIAEVSDGPGKSVGLQVGDKITSVNNQHIDNRVDWDRLVAQSAQQEVELQWIRDGKTLSEKVQLAAHKDNPKRGYLGVAFTPTAPVVKSYDPLSAIPQAFVLAVDTFERIASGIVKLVTGDVSIKHVGGPIQIAEVAGDSAKSGLGYYLGLLAALSIMLGIMNLLPVPVLDGGHLLYYAIEWVRGKPLSQRAQAIGLRIGLALIAMLMVLAFTNDFIRVGERIGSEADQDRINLCAQE